MPPSGREPLAARRGPAIRGVLAPWSFPVLIAATIRTGNDQGARTPRIAGPRRAARGSRPEGGMEVRLLTGDPQDRPAGRFGLVGLEDHLRRSHVLHVQHGQPEL